jgi:hypothetical protein
MKRKRFSVEQIVAILKQAEMGMPVAELTLDRAMLQDVLRKNW